MRITRSVVPSLFTILNIFSGFLSIIYASKGEFVMASWLIILAALFDVFDGLMARVTRTASKFGVELDSLADVVSFGAAPSFLMYHSYLHQYGNVGIFISSSILIFGALRLARFNSQLVGFDKDSFKGLPIPFSGMVIAAFVLKYFEAANGLYSGYSRHLIIPLMVIMGLIMVSKVKYDTLPKFKRKEFKQHPYKTVGFLIGIFIVVVSWGSLLFEVLFSIVLFGIVRHLVWKIGLLPEPIPETPALHQEKIRSIDI